VKLGTLDTLGAIVAVLWVQLGDVAVGASQESWAYFRVEGWKPAAGLVLVDSTSAEPVSTGLFRCAPGRHRITVMRNLPVWPPVHRCTFDTLLAADDTLTFRLPEVITIRSTPADAEVRLGDELLGKTPLRTIAEPWWEGKTLRVRKAGFEEATVPISNYRVGIVDIALVPQNPLPLPGGRRNPSAGRWQQRTLVSAVLTLSAGILAVELRNEANRTYAEYERTGSLQRMRQLYDRTVKLDRYSAACYAAFEVGFVVSFYCFLRWQALNQR
jgi:hypothetical protein